MMKLGRPWSVEGVHARVRETAHEAARRSGMTVGEWLDSIIIEQAADQGVYSRDLDADDPNVNHELAAMNDRLAALIRQVNRLERVNPAAQGAPGPLPQPGEKIPQQ